jgi:hypothetical protein
VPISRLRKGLMAGVKLGTFFPGFPTLQHINHTAFLKKAQVLVTSVAELFHFCAAPAPAKWCGSTGSGYATLLGT